LDRSLKNEVLHGVKEEGNILCTIKWRRLTGMITSGVGTASYNTLLKESEKEGE
jgi:hypothetical protein